MCLLDDFAPQDGWKIFVARAESCNCVVLEGLDGPLFCIGVVVMWFYELHLDAFVFKVRFYCFCCNIINDVENRFEISLFKIFYVRFEGYYFCLIFKFFTGVTRTALEDQPYSMKMAVLPSMERMGKLPV